MRTIMIGLAMAVLATQAAAQNQTAGFFAFRGEGERGWEATCTLQRVGGRTLQREMTGPRDAQQVIAARSIIGGRCEFRASTTGPLTLANSASNLFDSRSHASPSRSRATNEPKWLRSAAGRR